jgi:hypothetical protein
VQQPSLLHAYLKHGAAGNLQKGNIRDEHCMHTILAGAKTE